MCADNSICSTMAEVLKRLGRFTAFSAGVRPRDDEARRGGLSKHMASGIRNLQVQVAPGFLRRMHRMDCIISLGEQTPAGLPAVWLETSVSIKYITGPIVDGDAAQRASSFRKVFMELENRISCSFSSIEKKVYCGAQRR